MTDQVQVTCDSECTGHTVLSATDADRYDGVSIKKGIHLPGAGHEAADARDVVFDALAKCREVDDLKGHGVQK
ncbi:hypothetical protein [Paraburkholderia hospita]|jgi:hypothetical protein|uniref:hypothetical protein n=1 Tax=Paraburkholderia hospita TaxID=169430 RepID=UPI0014050D63|nr:hypothetical protein [Paraburkholderia hospita]